MLCRHARPFPAGLKPESSPPPCNTLFQGSVGDCCFVGSMAIIAEHPEFVNRRVQTLVAVVLVAAVLVTAAT